MTFAQTLRDIGRSTHRVETHSGFPIHIKLANGVQSFVVLFNHRWLNSLDSLDCQLPIASSLIRACLCEVRKRFDTVFHLSYGVSRNKLLFTLLSVSLIVSNIDSKTAINHTLTSRTSRIGISP